MPFLVDPSPLPVSNLNGVFLMDRLLHKQKNELVDALLEDLHEVCLTHLLRSILIFVSRISFIAHVLSFHSFLINMKFSIGYSSCINIAFVLHPLLGS